MEVIPFSGNLLKSHWRKRKGYNKLSPKSKRTVKTVKLGTAENNTTSSSKRSWRLKLASPKLRLARLASSPVKLWYKFKSSYMKMMLRLANTSGTSNSGNVFGAKRIPKARDAPMAAYSRIEFENRLVLEIYKSMVASLELGYRN